jgi:RNA-directed DNA polymerase
VTSYRKGVGIFKNAEMHVGHNYLLKMDFQNFFPSITKIDIRKLIMDNATIIQLSELDEQDIDLITKIVCKAGQLIGAPSSPSISNAVLYRFDDFISKESANRKIQYSRYADDISFSTNTPNVLDEIHEIVANTLLNQFSPRLTINEEKTAFTSKKRRRLVTGLVLTSGNRVSIGRAKKREVKTLCYRFSSGKLLPDQVSYLTGYLSYVRSVEPAFIQSLQRKYGDEIMQKIMGSPLVRRK